MQMECLVVDCPIHLFPVLCAMQLNHCLKDIGKNVTDVVYSAHINVTDVVTCAVCK